MNKNAGMKCPKTHATGEECTGCPECFSALPEAGSMKPRALLYSETVNEVAVRRDDLWIVTTAYVNAAAAFEAQAVAWIIYAELDGEMVPQHPASSQRSFAERDARMYGQTRTEVRPLYLAAPSAQPAGAAPDVLTRRYLQGDASHDAVRDIHHAVMALKAQPADQQPAGAPRPSMWEVFCKHYLVDPENIDYDGVRWIAFTDGYELAAASLVASVAPADTIAKLKAQVESKDTQLRMLAEGMVASVAQPVPADAEIPPLPEPNHYNGYSGNIIAARDAMWSARVRAALASHSTVPVGWQLVPIETTEDMHIRGCEATSGYVDWEADHVSDGSECSEMVEGIYAAMLRNAPAAPVCQAVVPEQAGWISVPVERMSDAEIVALAIKNGIPESLMNQGLPFGLRDQVQRLVRAVLAAAAPTPGAA